MKNDSPLKEEMSRSDRGVTKAAGCGEAAHLPLTQEAEKTKPQVLSAAVPPSDEFILETAQLTSAYKSTDFPIRTSRFCG